MKIAFRSNQLCERGTEVALWDYAHYNEKLLGNESIVISQRWSGLEDPQLIALPKFNKRFETILYPNGDNAELNRILKSHQVDVIYNICHGGPEPNEPRNVKVCNHCVFDLSAPRGDVYAAISEWLSKDRSNGLYPWVHHIIDIPSIEGNLRKELNIPEDALVFGRHGGKTTFDLDFVHNFIEDIVNVRNDVYFIFLNTNQFCESHPQIIHLPMTLELDIKAKFINTCDAMLHARSQGETFGIAIGEFVKYNKPILTWINGVDKAHHFMLKDGALYYNDYNDLWNIIDNWNKEVVLSKDWDVYKDKYSPTQVMQEFKEVFLS